MQAHVFCRRLLLSVGRDHLGVLSRTILPFLNLCMRKSFLIGIYQWDLSRFYLEPTHVLCKLSQLV